MRINPADRYLSLALDAVRQRLVPELQSSSAKATADIVCAVLSELLKREQGSAPLLRESIAAGEALGREIVERLGIQPCKPVLLAENPSLQALLQRHGDLTVKLTDLCEELSETIDDQAVVSTLLRKVAEWELAFYTAQAALPLPQLPAIDAPGRPLDTALLGEFLSQEEGRAVEVLGLQQLTGGFGKQTFLATLRRGEASDELVVRKTDATPIMKHGACRLDSEYDLLRLLPEDYPAPKPQRFCSDHGGVDGSYYTMARIAGATPGSYLGGVEGKIDEAIFLELAELLARLHQQPLCRFADYIRRHEDARILEASVDDCYRYNLEGWTRYLRQETHLQSPYLVWLLDWLQRNIPKDARRPVLVHGDFNIHNVLVDQGRVTAVLDWECAGFGAPEQDLAYIQPHISKHIEWSRFVNHYLSHGGVPIHAPAMRYGLVYASLRTVLAANRATRNLQSGANRDIRYAMVELGFTASFMGQALQGTQS